MSFTDLFIRRPVLATVVSLLIFLVGLRSYSELPIRQFPDLTSSTITVQTNYPGASADLVQGFITQPIEAAVASAEGIDFMTSSSTLGSSTITVYIQLNYDPNKAMTEILAKIQEVKYELPTAAFDPVITKATPGTFAAAYLSFNSDSLSSVAIADFVTRVVQPVLAAVPGVAKADTQGSPHFAMRIWLDPMRMAARGIGADDVSNAIRANNFQSAPGQVKSYFTQFNVTADTGSIDVDAFRDLVVKSHNDELVRISDIARVELGPENDQTRVTLSGHHSIFIAVFPTPDANPVDVIRGVRERIPDIERTLPPSVHMIIGYDATKFISAAIEEVVHTLALAIIIVVAVIYLMLGNARAVLIPVVTIPLSLVGALALMAALGFSINLLTLLALVLAIGLVVDDAIIVVENVYRGIERGLTPMDAALVGAREIAAPIISMTITLAAVYTPVAFQGGLTGSLFREFALTLAGAVMISGVVALTLSPMMCSRMLTRESTEGWFARQVEKILSAVVRRYRRMLRASLAARPLVVVFAVGMLTIVVAEYKFSSNELAPAEDAGVMFSLYKAPQAANLDYTARYVDQAVTTALKEPEIELGFNVTGAGGANSGFGGLVLKPWSERKRGSGAVLAEVQKRVQAAEAGVKALYFNLPPLPGGSGGLPVQLVISTASGFEPLFRVIDEIRRRADKSGLFIVTDVDLAYDQPTVTLHVDRSKANNLGISMQAIGDTLAVMVGENYINRFNLEGRSYEVITQVPRSDRLEPSDLTKYYVETSAGTTVPLSTVVNATIGREPNALTHYNQLNSATFSAVPFPGRSMGEAIDFLEKTVKEVVPKDYQHDYLSDSRQFIQEGNSLAITFIFAFIVIYLVLAAQFESFRDPFVILVSVPMAASGALFPLFLGIATINIYSQIGLITLIGLIAKHGILMVEFANNIQERDGVDRIEAIARAAEARLRPILMTTFATVFGLIPLLIATGPGAASRFSIGLVLVAGMSVGTLFTLFVVPTVYTLIARAHHRDPSRAVPTAIPAPSVG